MEKKINLPHFVNREKEIKVFKTLLSTRPNLIYFVYGPINSGKTTLLNKVFELLPHNYRVFYINFRWRDVQKIEDLLQVLFEVRYEKKKEKLKEIVKELAKESIQKIKPLKGIPIPEKVFDYLFESSKKIEDIFRYLENIFEELAEEKINPVFVLDELQTIKDVVNRAGRPVLSGLFNFLVGITKEKHLCHVFCATSDCLFIENIYNEARLEGRAEYVLIDDLKKKDALEAYKEFGFKNKELMWNYIGGKIGDMVRVLEKMKLGLTEEKAIYSLFESEKDRIEWTLKLLEEGEKIGPDLKELKKVFQVFKEKEEVKAMEVNLKCLKFLVKENFLFYDPVKKMIKPQSRLIARAFEELF